MTRKMGVKALLSAGDIAKRVMPETKVPSVINPAPNIQTLTQAVTQLKEIVETREGQRGTALDSNITWRELYDNGVVNFTVNGETVSSAQPNPYVRPNTPAMDMTIPPLPENLTASGALASVILSWTVPQYGNHAYTEIWRSSSDNLGTAVLTGTSTGSVYADNVGQGGTYYYWVRLVTTADVRGGYNAQAGVLGQTSYNASYLIDVLAANPPDTSYNKLLYVLETEYTAPDGTVVPPGTYMSDGYLANGVITNAKIANAAVDDAKIANLTAAKITAGDIHADRMTANIVAAATGRFDVLSALSGSLGTVQIGNTGHLRNADATDYGTGVGFWMGFDVSQYKFRIGDPAGNRLTWDGTSLNIYGGGNFSGALNAATGTFAGSLSAATGSFGNVEVDANGSLRGGMATAYGTGVGLWTGYDGTTYKFRVGDPGAGGKGIFWDGTSLTINGTMAANTITTPMIVSKSATALDFTTRSEPDATAIIVQFYMDHAGTATVQAVCNFGFSGSADGTMEHRIDIDGITSTQHSYAGNWGTAIVRSSTLKTLRASLGVGWHNINIYATHSLHAGLNHRHYVSVFKSYR